MLEADRQEFTTKMNSFVTYQEYTSFLDFMMNLHQYCLDDSKFMNWSTVYQSHVYINM